jgi:5'-methylthioadenosine phosphorylase
MILGVLGGSGLYDIDGLDEARAEEVPTPFGAPSAPVVTGRIGGARLLFLPRHGRGHRFSPSEINYRANVYALKALGATRVLSVSAVGSLREGLPPGDLVLPDQFIDKTWARGATFFGGGVVGHVSFAEPTCPAFGDMVASATRAAGFTEAAREARRTARLAAGKHLHRGGTYVCMEGPQFSTRAESELHRSWGADVIGMTAASEAKLCREAELCFAALALVTDYDGWHAEEAAVTAAAVVEVLRQNVAGAKAIVRLLPAAVAASAAPCGCARAAAHAVLTAPDAIPADARQRLQALLGRDL